MKAKNIKVGEYVVGMHNTHIYKVIQDWSGLSDELDIQNITTCSKRFRKPTIADLNPGDLFEWDGDQFEMVRRLIKGGIEVNFVGTTQLGNIDDGTKVRITSLADEKPALKSERKTATVWMNCNETGRVDAYNTRKGADYFADHNRVACVEVTVPWTVGEGLK